MCRSQKNIFKRSQSWSLVPEVVIYKHILTQNLEVKATNTIIHTVSVVSKLGATQLGGLARPASGSYSQHLSWAVNGDINLDLLPR